MHIATNKAIDVISKEFHISRDTVLDEGIRYFLEKKLREIKAEIFRITGKYKISSVKEFDELYKKGLVEEKDSWEDFQRLDHLEFKRDEIEKLLQELR